MSDFHVVDDTPEERDEQVYAPAASASTARRRGSIPQYPQVTAPLPYATAAATQEPARHRTPPAYREITSGAGMLRAIAAVVMCFAVLTGIGGLLLTLVIMRADGPLSAFSVVIVLIAFTVEVVTLLAGAAILRMLAAMGEALRDVARNSFR